MDNTNGVEVIIEDLSNHPKCPHGPTLLFSRSVNCSGRVRRRFYACAACRDRKDCSFFLWEDQIDKVTFKKEVVKVEKQKLVSDINHKELYQKFHKLLQQPPNRRYYCHNCNILLTDKISHGSHQIISPLSDHLLQNPTKFLKPKENSKKEAQYLFAESSTKVIIDTIKHLNLRNILCIGTPRIHEYIKNNGETYKMNSLLLDFDERFHNFFGPLEFCWYNSFNHHFFGGTAAKNVFEEFLQSENGKHSCIIMDPPFGGRIEPLAHSLRLINTRYQQLNKTKNSIPTLWIFPYFMEPQILNSLPDFIMLDYKVDYDNHSLFSNKSKGRKYGSPVRMFTNISASQIPFPTEEGYRYCKACKRWVSSENKHCNICNCCASKDGRTYKHCNVCSRCVKPSWQHCDKCERCCLPTHKCGEFIPSTDCFHCKQHGHKKNQCPNLNTSSRKRRNISESETVDKNNMKKSRNSEKSLIKNLGKNKATEKRRRRRKPGKRKICLEI